MTGSRSPWTKLARPTKKGHRYFAHRDHEGAIAVADRSGPTPDRTDDGPLWLDVSAERPVHVGVNSIGVPSCNLPVHKGEDPGRPEGEYFTGTDSLADLKWLVTTGHVDLRHVILSDDLRKDAPFLGAIAAIQATCNAVLLASEIEGV